MNARDDTYGMEHVAREMRKTLQSDRLAKAPIGTKAPAVMGGHWVKVELGWKWFCGDTFPRPGGDWNGKLIEPGQSDSQEL